MEIRKSFANDPHNNKVIVVKKLMYIYTKAKNESALNWMRNLLNINLAHPCHHRIYCCLTLECWINFQSQKNNKIFKLFLCLFIFFNRNWFFGVFPSGIIIIIIIIIVIIRLHVSPPLIDESSWMREWRIV